MQTNQTPAEQLLALIEELKLPICPEDTLSYVSKLSDDEIETLIPSFEYVQSYHRSLSKDARAANPQKYEEAETAFQHEIHELRKNYLKQEEQIHEKYDQKADDNDTQTEGKMGDILNQNERDTEDIEKSYSALLEKMQASAHQIAS